MRFIVPSERLEINSMADAELVKRLPSVIIIQRTRNGLNEESVPSGKQRLKKVRPTCWK